MNGRDEGQTNDGKSTRPVLFGMFGLAATCATACALSLLLLVDSALAAPGGGRGKVSDEVASQVLGSGPDDLVPVIVQTFGDPTADHVARALGLGAVLKAKHQAIHGYSASVPASQLMTLADDPSVERISLDAPVKTNLDVAVRAVRADVAQAMGGGLDGSGVGIALVDTGVESHPDLDRAGHQNDVFEVDLVGPKQGVEDSVGHGTHVAGILNGNGLMSSGPSSFRTFRGMAPGARLISLRALQPDGTGRSSDVVRAIDWVLAHRRGFNIRVVNLSLGHPVFESYATDPLCRAAKAAVDAGIVVVAAAGNSGRVGSGFGTIDSPGDEPSVVTVGAMDTNRTVARDDDVLAPYSSKGPTLIDAVAKPDLVAPGSFIVSLRAPGSMIDTLHHEVVLRRGDYRTDGDPTADGDYLALSGTSLAAPMVSGAAALLLQNDPSLRPSDVKARLMESATKDGHLPFETGAGYLDVAAALLSTVHADSVMSPRAVVAPDGTITLQPIDGTWSGDWNLGLIWGGNRLFGLLWQTENDQVTASGMVWGGGGALIQGDDPSVDACGMVWGGGG